MSLDNDDLEVTLGHASTTPHPWDMTEADRRREKKELAERLARKIPPGFAC